MAGAINRSARRSSSAGARTRPALRIARAAIVALALGVTAAADARAQETDAVARGAYVFRAAGGCSCHTDVARKGAYLAGGRPLKTPFGIFYGPNITPDAETGIGGWSAADFLRAMRQGVAPDGSHYFPVFPYTSFTKASDQDLDDLWAYLGSVPAVRQANRDHEVSAPYGWRATVGPWKWLYFAPGRGRPDPGKSEAWNRGAYLANALSHCGECHTPRDALGGPDEAMWYAGTKDGPEGEPAPNITPHAATGIGRWSSAQIANLLKTGLKPDFDDVQGVMAEAIDQGFRHLSGADRAAIAEYVLSLPPIENRVEPDRAASDSPYD